MVGTRSQCTFCSQLKTDLYLCPRCEQNYCSSRCYRSEKHHECWEDFCRRHVEEDLKGRGYDRDSSFTSRPLAFEQFMDPDSGQNAEVGSEENAEPVDSDDEEVDYLEKVTETTLAEFESADESEVERRLATMGVGTEPEQLYAVLNDSEKVAFARLADRICSTEFGYESSVFRSKPNVDK